MADCTSRSFFSIEVNHPSFKFNCAHFIALQGYREKLHGHNYTVGVRVQGSSGDNNNLNRCGTMTNKEPFLGSDGYLCDFSDIKRVLRAICCQFDEHFICPMNSPVLRTRQLLVNVVDDLVDDSRHVVNV